MAGCIAVSSVMRLGFIGGVQVHGGGGGDQQPGAEPSVNPRG
jgi:hypothetical protein